MPYSIEAMLGYVLPVSAMGNLLDAKALFQKSMLIKPNNPSVEYGLSLIK